MEVRNLKESFDSWNQEKQILEMRTDLKDFFVEPGDIWYTKLGINIGFEEDGKKDFQRPVLVIERIGILFFVVPLTTKDKGNTFYRHLKSVTFGKPSLVILSQARVIDKRRFINPIGKISDNELLEIKKLLKDMYLPGV